MWGEGIFIFFTQFIFFPLCLSAVYDTWTGLTANRGLQKDISNPMIGNCKYKVTYIYINQGIFEKYFNKSNHYNLLVLNITDLINFEN